MTEDKLFTKIFQLGSQKQTIPNEENHIIGCRVGMISEIKLKIWAHDHHGRYFGLHGYLLLEVLCLLLKGELIEILLINKVALQGTIIVKM